MENNVVCAFIVTFLTMASGQSVLAPPGGGMRIPSVPTVPQVPRPRPGSANGSPGGARRMSNANAPQAGPSITCASAGKNVITQCFQAPTDDKDGNGGFQMQYVIGLMTRGSQGSVPSNANRMREAVCGQEGVIIACVFEGINSLEGGPQCQGQGDYSRLEQETVSLISGLQSLCGKGPLPASSPCLNELNTKLRGCFSEVGMDPGIFYTGNAMSVGNLSQTVGAIIGKDKKVASKFCRIKERLFSCMQRVVDGCEGSTEVVALSGFEPEALRKGIEVLCHDVIVYVDGLQCFQKAPPTVDRCYGSLQEAVSELTAQQLQTSMPLSQFYDRFCQLRVQHMECDLQAWKGQCEPSTIGLKNEFECALLPSRCKNDRSLQGRLQQTCSITRFQRQLRSAAAPTLTWTKGVMMVASMVFAVIIL